MDNVLSFHSLAFLAWSKRELELDHFHDSEEVGRGTGRVGEVSEGLVTHIVVEAREVERVKEEG